MLEEDNVLVLEDAMPTLSIEPRAINTYTAQVHDQLQHDFSAGRLSFGSWSGRIKAEFLAETGRLAGGAE